ncbi:DUF1905 domain-containing protein [Streptomyces sp. NPDC019531]|uniref:DUF1905 domain-containing protein n=1 Tax=Streptomyces sp. NPDC019531 TaxID=3365062 RepID=UPI00384FC5F9
MQLTFTGRVIEWRGPAPYCFVPVPDQESADIGEVTFTTSLFPKDGSCLLPLKQAVRRPEGPAAGDDVRVELTVRC